MHYQIKKRIGAYIGLVLAFIILSYTVFELKDVIRGPEVTVEYPKNGSTLHTGLVSLRGSAVRVASIQVNGGELFTDLSGHFKKDILLSEGYNVIQVIAKDSFGRSTSQKIELVAERIIPGAPVARSNDIIGF